MADTRKDPALMTGTELRSLFEAFNPFDSASALKPPEARRTVLAVNGNFPMEIELAAFFQAAALEGGSPLIVQFSGAALETQGRGLKPKPGSEVLDLRLGARMTAAIARTYLSVYRPRSVALGLDHFAVPELGEALFADKDPDSPEVPCPSGNEVRSRLNEALDAAEAYGVKRPSQEDAAAWETYLGSQEYRRALAGFMAVIEEMRPAWAMIDTGEIPAGLNFAITKEVCDLIHEAESDAIVEAEFGATSQAGDEDSYVPLRGAELSRFAREVGGFVRYTGASGISYPIGMEHAAPTAVKHEPDTTRLEIVQREIMKVAGRYVPFAQHGGTGAREVARGLVAKDNVNTLFLVKGAQALAMHVAKYREGIAQGRKSACGASMYTSTSRAVLDATIDKLKECGTYGVLLTM